MKLISKFCQLRNPNGPACRHRDPRLVNPWRRMFRSGAVLLFSLGAVVVMAAEVPGGLPGAVGGGAGTLELPATVQVDGGGVFLPQIVVANPPVSLPQLRIAAAPGPGQMLTYSRAQVADLVARQVPDLAGRAWVGGTQVRVIRRMRMLEEAELKQYLTDALQREQVKERGELELRLMRPWTAVNIPDDPFTLRVLDLPTTGISPNFIVRFELRTAQEAVGGWQLFLQARIMREVLVARSALKRGMKLREADLGTERRDVLTLRDPLTEVATQDDTLELGEYVPAGQPLAARAVRVRPVVLRGSLAEALVQDGALSVSIKVEVLEDGIPGQIVRVRNLQTKREFHGKVRNEQTILVTL